MDTVKKNRKNYTARQFERAKRARLLSHMAGHPTDDKLKQLLRMNVIQNCPVVPEDVDLMVKIFGSTVSRMKGTMTRRKTKTVRGDLVQLPPELLEKHENLVLCVDLFHVNKIPMFTSIDRSIKFRGVVPLRAKEESELYTGLELVILRYKRAGFKITKVHADNEFGCIKDDMLRDYGVDVNCANPGDHVPEVERSIRVIKERMWATYHALPYRYLPTVLVRYLAMVCAQRLNMFPVEGGVCLSAL